ncbi:MAG: energy-coupling factor transporter transmembrane component T family protein [Clostridium sp.]|uniref:energy-coupling factor transporter transmembrane component T family protein n=1 Tax=Clostridium sp. TaxID=1506 RepID=UPI003EE52830
MNGLLEYSYKDSFVHNRVGATKLIFLISFITAAMISYDTRFLLGMLGLSVVIFKLSKVKFKDISFVFYFILVFLVSTDPSKFAASLSKIGISYRVAYSVAIALRYIPDIQREYKEISFAKQEGKI